MLALDDEGVYWIAKEVLRCRGLLQEHGQLPPQQKQAGAPNTVAPSTDADDAVPMMLGSPSYARQSLAAAQPLTGPPQSRRARQRAAAATRKERAGAAGVAPTPPSTAAVVAHKSRLRRAARSGVTVASGPAPALQVVSRPDRAAVADGTAGWAAVFVAPGAPAAGPATASPNAATSRAAPRSPASVAGKAGRVGITAAEAARKKREIPTGVGAVLANKRTRGGPADLRAKIDGGRQQRRSGLTAAASTGSTAVKGAAAKQVAVCRHFRTEGGCSRGAKCWFKHG